MPCRCAVEGHDTHEGPGIRHIQLSLCQGDGLSTAHPLGDSGILPFVDEFDCKNVCADQVRIVEASTLAVQKESPVWPTDWIL
jgi:hypothetical protein